MRHEDRLPVLLHRVQDAPPPAAPAWRAGTEVDRTRRQGRGRAGVAAGAVAPPADERPRDPLARRIAALHLPGLAMERYLRHRDRQGDPVPDDLPLALAVDGPHGPVLHAANRAARLAGMRLGERVVDMRALCPELQVEFADTSGDWAMLARLMLWCRRWCPWTALDGDTGLVMDTTGSDHLWGGEAAMLRDIEEKFALMGLSCDLATAPTHGAAWALSRHGGLRETCPAAELAPRMAPLPVAALRLEADTVLLLHRLGLKTVGDLAAVPRRALARRFARAELPRNPLMRLDQMMGRLAEPVQSPDDPPRFAVQSRLPEPVSDPEPLLPGMAQDLCAGLAAAGMGARRVTLQLYRTDGEVASLSVATARASRAADHLLRLFEGRLERLDPGFGFDLVTLEASVAERLDTVQTRIDGHVDSDTELARLVDRLSARFGADRITRPAPRDSHVPERRERWQSAMAPAARAPEAPRSPRPLRLLDPPEEIRVLYAVPDGPPVQFVWRRLTHKVTRFAGPERIAPEWWADRPTARLRDYYRVETHHGRRYWLFREGMADDGRGGAPRWVLHGVFS
jgi:protein ImuB